jgi:tetrahydrodipicolinate N-succinyltransferase
MIGKSKQEIEQTILFHVEQYQTLLKIASKQKQQAKYAIQFLDQLKEKFSEQLNPEEKETLNMRFAHFLDQRPTTNKTLERERVRVDKEVDKSKLALEKARALLRGTGIKTRFDQGFKSESNNGE